MSNTIIHLASLDDYKQAISIEPCIIKFTANWCGPCQAITPFFVSLIKDNFSIKVIEIDCDNSSAITEYEDVKSIPLFLFYFQGQKISDLTLASANQFILSQNYQKFLNMIQPINQERIIQIPSNSTLSYLSEDGIESNDSEDDILPDIGDDNIEEAIIISENQNIPENQNSNDYFFE